MEQKIWIFIIQIFLNIFNVIAYPPTGPVIKINDGSVRGIFMNSRNGTKFEAYRGIPYAMPPVGDLRFKAPRPVRPWDGTLDATKNGPVCIQKNYLFANATVEGQEDCLYLNVYTPTIGLNRTKLLPVMVYIHWGGFFAGRSSSDFIGPKILMDKNVILVSFNYRLGIFGFLSTLDDEAPGNYALKDQVLALKWIRNNIHHFGGDNKRITIFGTDSGAAATHWHMLSPLSKGLFQQAISQSGTALTLWANPQNKIHKKILRIQASISGCNGNNSKLLIDCLRKIDAKILVESGDSFKYFSIDPMTVYSLVIEKKTERNPKPFITKMPIEYIESGDFEKVPWIIGSVQNEGNIRASPLMRQIDTRNAFNKNFTNLMMKEMNYDVSVGLDEEKKLEIFKKAQYFYMDGRIFLNPNDPKRIQGFIDLWSDRFLTYSMYQSAMIHSAHKHTPIWMYNFEYKGKYSYGDLWAATDNFLYFDWGVSHCDDLLYLFDSPELFPKLSEKRDVEMSNILVERWTNFAIYGTPQRSTYENHWDSLNFTGISNMKNENLYFLNITGSFNGNPIKETMQNGFHKDRMLFWASQDIFENFFGLR